MAFFIGIFFTPTGFIYCTQSKKNGFHFSKQKKKKMAKRVIWFNSKLDDCMEQVPFGDGIACKIINPELRSLVERYVQVNLVEMKNPRPRRFPGALPTTIFRTQLPSLTNGKELWAEKTAGIRYRFLALKLCSDVSFSSSTCLALPTQPQQQLLDPCPPTTIPSLTELSERAALAAIPVPEETVSLIGNKKKYKKKAKTLVTVLEDEDEEEEDEKKNDKKYEAQDTSESIVASLKLKQAEMETAKIAKQKKKKEEEEEEENESDDASGSSSSSEDEKSGPSLFQEFVNTGVRSKSSATVNSLVFDKKAGYQSKAPRKTIKEIQYLNALMDRSGEIYALPNVLLPESIYPALLDGEMAKHKPSGKWHFLVFNLSVSNGYAYRGWNYHTRMIEYCKFCQLFQNEFQEGGKTPPISEFLPKIQYFWCDYDKAFYNYKFGPYDCDGTLGTRNAKAKEHGTDWDTFKVKAMNENTIELVPEEQQDSSMFYLLAGGYLNAKGDLVDSDNLYPAQSDQDDLYHFFSNNDLFTPEWIENRNNWKGKVFESLWNERTNQYTAIRERPDKRHPNNAHVIKQTKTNIREGVTPEEVFALWQQWKASDRLEKEKVHALARESNRMMEVHHTTTHELDFLKSMQSESNWKPSLIPVSEMSQYITSMKLSWELETEEEMQTAQRERNEDFPISFYPEQKLPFNKDEQNAILNVENLKAIVKNKRKGRKKTLGDETVDESVDITINSSSSVAKKKTKKEKKKKKETAKPSKHAKVLKQSKRQLRAEGQDDSQMNESSVLASNSIEDEKSEESDDEEEEEEGSTLKENDNDDDDSDVSEANLRVADQSSLMLGSESVDSDAEENDDDNDEEESDEEVLIGANLEDAEENGDDEFGNENDSVEASDNDDDDDDDYVPVAKARKRK
jgi:hypothetical protein